MTPPIATYRLQFRSGMTFARAASLAGYFARLGVSHLYSSPLFAAAEGSTHGYDAIDFGRIEPALGGEEGFEHLSAALEEVGLGLLLDFVPNHMAAADGNRWWHSVLEWGAASPSAAVFDIDWSAPKLILPRLGVSYDRALRDGIFGIAFDAESGCFSFTCYDRRLPLTPPSYEKLLARVADDKIARLAPSFAKATVGPADRLKQRLAGLAAKPGGAEAIAAVVDAAATDRDLLNDLHEAQIWRLADWRLGREALTYRRFFEIADLICLRVEEPAVFAAVHARLLELIGAGRIVGVRIDHIDGLADPKAYLMRLQEAIGQTQPYFLLVEKILERGEGLRPDWPVAGTTGYEFIAALANLFVDSRREAEMNGAYCEFTGTTTDYPDAACAAKREIFEHNLAAELATLMQRARVIAAADIATRDLDSDSLRRAIVEIAAALPVYRSYIDASGPAEVDSKLIEGAVSEARMSRNVEDAAAIDFIARLLLLEVGSPAPRDLALAFVTRFQQTTGPVMAKGIEDTMFYRYNRLIALNEVGGAPECFGAPLSAFHAAMDQRGRAQPMGLSATATHDTKRGEDARARLYVLSEMPETWRAAVDRWAVLNASYRVEHHGGRVPEPTMEWMFYQALAGAWPADLEIGDLSDADNAGLAILRTRMLAYIEKTAREAKTRTSWIYPDKSYEEGFAAFVTAVLSPKTGGEFLSDFTRTCNPVWVAGAVNSLAQLAIKLTAPGVPDIYQGTELWDFSLVDPDNRAPVNFSVRQHLLEKVIMSEPEVLLEDWVSGVPKMALMSAGLRMRARRSQLFSEGTYRPLSVAGKNARHVLAFARILDKGFAVTIAPRLALGLIRNVDRPMIPANRWGDTAVQLPDPLCDRPMRDALTGVSHTAGSELRVADVLARFPVATLHDAE